MKAKFLRALAAALIAGGLLAAATAPLAPPGIRSIDTSSSLPVEP